MKHARSRPGRKSGPAAPTKGTPARPAALTDLSESSAWLYALASSGLLLVALTARRLSDADLGYHLRGGRWILEHLRFPSTDVYTFTRSAADYVDLHWIFQLLVYGVYRLGGYASLTLFNIVLVAAVFAVTLARMASTGAARWMRVVLLVLAIVACEPRFEVRPEILTWLLMSLMLWVLEHRHREPRALVLLPVIQIAWTNSEGLFILGPGLIAAYLLSDLVHHSTIEKPFWIAALAACAGCLVNPYFVRGLQLPFTYLATLSGSNPFKQTIAEFQSPWAVRGSATNPAMALGAYKGYVVVLAVGLLATLAKRRLHEIAIAAALFYLSATAIRNIPLFVLTTLPLAAASWTDVPWRWWRRAQTTVLAKPLAAWLVTAIVLLMSLRAVSNAQYIAEGRVDRFGLGLDNDTQPARAAAFLVDRHLDGRILNQLNTGGWLDWTRPGQVFIDGRTEVMGEDLYVESMEAQSAGGLARLVARYHPDILFLNPFGARQWVRDLNQMPEWRLVHADESAAVFLRSGYAPEIQEVDAGALLSARSISSDVTAMRESLLQRPPPSAWQRATAQLFAPPPHPNGLQMLALLFQYRGDYRTSERFFLEMLKRSRGAYADLYFNAGLMYYAWHQPVETARCMQRVLAEDPDNAVAARLLREAAN